MKEEIKTLLLAKYQKAFSLYNKKEAEFFSAFNSNNGDWTQAKRELVKALKDIEETIQEIIKHKK